MARHPFGGAVTRASRRHARIHADGDARSLRPVAVARLRRIRRLPHGARRSRNADAALATATRLVLSPVLALSALQLSTLLTGAVVVESVFALPGLGSMMVRDIANRDVTKVQSTLLVIVVAVFVIRLVVDAINDRLDPRRLA